MLLKHICGNMLSIYVVLVRRTLIILHIQTFDMNIKYSMHLKKKRFE